MEAIISSISSSQTLYRLSKQYEQEEAETCAWLSPFVSYLSQSEHSSLLEKHGIVPNQNSKFCQPSELFYESEPIDDLLKDIAAELRRDFRDELVDLRFVLDIPQNRSIDTKSVAREISEAVYPRLAENPREEKTQLIFNKIILWMDENPELAVNVFVDLAENRHKLYDDRQIAANLRKVAKLESEVKQLSEENSSLRQTKQELEDKVKELEAQLEAVSKSSTSSLQETANQYEVDQDFLVAYGITTADRLDKLLLDKEFKNRYIIRSREELLIRLQYVQEIIQRAKSNVRRYLDEHPDYDCSGWKEISETVIGGIVRRKQKISLVVRPSDNHKVIFYYSEEKDALEQPEAELWVENGNSHPHQITLGMVLKLQSIDVIKL